MNLKELKSMIKEELESYMHEADDDMEVSADAAMDDVAVDGGEMDMAAGGGAEETLRGIYDQLAAYFDGGEVEDKMDELPGDEGGEDMGDEDSMDEAKKDDMDEEKEDMDEAKKEDMDEAKKDKDLDEEKKDMDEEKEDMDEGTDGYTGKAGKGGTGYEGKAGRGGTGYDAGSKALKERFQKLANIIKG